jgi:hypothetical protein
MNLTNQKDARKSTSARLQLGAVRMVDDARRLGADRKQPSQLRGTSPEWPRWRAPRISLDLTVGHRQCPIGRSSLEMSRAKSANRGRNHE